MCLISHRTPAHISRLSLKARIFLLALFNPTSYPCQWKTWRQRFPPSSSSSGSSQPSRYRNNCTSSIFMLLCCFHDNKGREHYPEWFSQWRWRLFGWLCYWGQWSWQPLCAFFGFMHVCGGAGGVHALMHLQLHTLMHSHVCPSEDQSLHDSVRDCDIHLFLIKETVANWSTMFRADY